MRQRLAIALVAVVFALSGCAALHQAKEDYQAGKADPVAVTEAAEEAEAVGEIAGSFVPGATKPVGFLVACVLLWYKGRRKRLGLPTAKNPITGHLGGRTGLEAVVQAVANVSDGTFNWGGGSGKRGIKFLAIFGVSVLAILPAITQIPAVSALLVQHEGLIFPLLGAITAAVASVEKGLQRVLPVENGKPDTA
jgi:hypothetical protein